MMNKLLNLEERTDMYPACTQPDLSVVDVYIHVDGD